VVGLKVVRHVIGEKQQTRQGASVFYFFCPCLEDGQGYNWGLGMDQSLEKSRGCEKGTLGLEKLPRTEAKHGCVCGNGVTTLMRLMMDGCQLYEVLLRGRPNQTRSSFLSTLHYAALSTPLLALQKVETLIRRSWEIVTPKKAADGQCVARFKKQKKSPVPTFVQRSVTDGPKTRVSM